MGREEKLDQLLTFRRVMEGPSGAACRAILRELCRADRSGFAATPHETAYLAGRKDVWRDLERLMTLPLDALETYHNSLTEKEQNHAGNLLD